jgi:hypothetical protein
VDLPRPGLAGRGSGRHTPAILLGKDAVNHSGRWPLIVVGAGAAGLLAGTFAARAGVRTLVLEGRPRPGAKIRISGGGRCNVLPSVASPDDFRTGGSDRLVRNVLGSWPLEDVRTHFERHLGVALKVERTGKVFPVSDASRDVVDALLRDLAKAGATLQGDARITALHREGDGFRLERAGGAALHAERVVLATGGRSLPKTGSDGAGLGFARALGHAVRPDAPALVPLTTTDPVWKELSGVSLPAELTARRDGRALEVGRGDFLFTHRGFSGPVVLDISGRFTQPEEPADELRVRWGEADAPAWEERLSGGGPKSVVGLLRASLPDRLADVLLRRAGVAGDRPLAQLPRDERQALAAQLDACRLDVSGSEGYRTAEVTLGGVPLEEIRTRTMESRKVPGLHLCGEILDVTGRLGGYNFLWAWVSGRRAGEGVAAG